MPKNKQTKLQQEVLSLFEDNPRILTTHTTYNQPVRRVTLTIIKVGTPDAERDRLLELSHKLANNKKK